MCVCVEREREREREREYNGMSIEIKPKFFIYFVRPFASIMPWLPTHSTESKRLAGGLLLTEEVVVLKMESGKVAIL